MLTFTKEQLSEVMCKHAEKENGLHDLLEIMLESLMVADNEDVAFYFTYLNYVPQIQAMIYTTNWIERLQKDFRRVTRMRGAMPDENSVIVLMGKTAMDKESYQRVIPRIREDATLFPVGSASKGD